MTLTEQQLAEIEARAEKATPGDWFGTKPPVEFSGMALTVHSDDFVIAYVPPDFHNNAEANSNFVSASRQDIPALIASLRAAMKALKGLVDQLDVVHNSPEYIGVWTLSQLHDGYYKGPTYTDALAAARAALKSE